jgi:hypothetical protein
MSASVEMRRAKAEARDADAAFLAALIAFGSRFASKVLTTAGHAPVRPSAGTRQILLLRIAFSSVI